MDRKNLTIVALAGLALGAAASATTFNEVEGNDNKAGANLISGLLHGDTIVGNTTGASTTVPGAASADYFRVRTATSPLGIYVNRLVITTTGTVGHTGTIRGLNQTAGGAAGGQIGALDNTVQTANTVGGVARTSQWYTFGREADIYYRVAGTASTTADYTATYSQSAVTANVISGNFNAGNITITTIGQGHTTDTDFWVYDANFNAIAGYGNDDNSVAGGGPGTGLTSLMTRNFAAGTYYLAIANFNTANNQASPFDERTQSGNVMDFADTLANSSATANVNVSFSMSDGVNTLAVAATRASAFDVLFYQFTVVPTPGAAALLGLAGLAGVRRRR